MLLLEREVTVEDLKASLAERVNHPAHYTAHPSGVECVQIAEHMNFNLGNALKYIWRADLKGDVIEDLKKAAWYVDREIERRQGKWVPRTKAARNGEARSA